MTNLEYLLYKYFNDELNKDYNFNCNKLKYKNNELK